MWEETWGIVGNNEFATTIGIPDDPSVSGFVVAGKPVGSFQYGPGLHLNAYGRAKLAACAPEMARMLLAIEWSGWNHEGYDPGGDCCPVCSGSDNPDLHENHRHTQTCALDALMRKAGIR